MIRTAGPLRQSTDVWPDLWRRTMEAARTPRIRTAYEFTRDEFIPHTGPFAYLPFDWRRQPFSRLLLDEYENRQWRRRIITGPSQTGKSLFGFVVPCMHHLFEQGDDVILGLPDMDMAKDKWERDIRPAIEASRYGSLLPTSGRGSRGGTPDSIVFRNGKTLKFMSGGGGDKSRAYFTARVVVVTETDGMDLSSETSREADKISQLETRTKAYGSRARIYLECTVSTAEGRTWREYQAGTCSKIVRPCPHCGGSVTPEREHLVGWQDADNKIEARDKAHFVCPACEMPWTEEERRAANLQGRLLHRGQSVVDGEIVGDAPQTDTLGFRWTAADNHFVTAGDLGADEWVASRAIDEENSQKAMCQFVWAMPPAPSLTHGEFLTEMALYARAYEWPRGTVPEGCDFLTIGVDVHKSRLYWVVVAWWKNATGHVVAYGFYESRSTEIGTEQGVFDALTALDRETLSAGWTWKGPQARVADRIFVDSGWLPRPVYELTRGRQPRLFSTKGYGMGQRTMHQYSKPQKKGGAIVDIGENYHVVILDAGSGRQNEVLYLIEFDADYWKTWATRRLTTGIGQPGAVTLFRGKAGDHTDFVRQILAQKINPDTGKWEPVRQTDHYLDAYTLACVSAATLGVSPLPPAVAPAAQQQPITVARTDEQPYFVLERTI